MPTIAIGRRLMSLAVPPPFAALPDASACGGREAAVIPVGIITAVAGVPMLFAIIARRGNEG